MIGYIALMYPLLSICFRLVCFSTRPFSLAETSMASTRYSPARNRNTMPPAQALAKRTEDDERRLSTLSDGQLSRDGGLLTARLSKRYADRITGNFIIPGREGAVCADSRVRVAVHAMCARSINPLRQSRFLSASSAHRAAR